MGTQKIFSIYRDGVLCFLKNILISANFYDICFFISPEHYVAFIDGQQRTNRRKGIGTGILTQFGVFIYFSTPVVAWMMNTLLEIIIVLHCSCFRFSFPIQVSDRHELRPTFISTLLGLLYWNTSEEIPTAILLQPIAHTKKLKSSVIHAWEYLSSTPATSQKSRPKVLLGTSQCPSTNSGARVNDVCRTYPTLDMLARRCHLPNTPFSPQLALSYPQE